MTDAELTALAFSMLEKAYCPYSGFPVGAALESEDGRIFTGCNVENAAFGASICAERTAVVKAVSAGAKSFRRIAVAGKSADFCCPCGTCRQVLNEFSPDMTVLSANGAGEVLSRPLSALLPNSFGPHNLND